MVRVPVQWLAPSPVGKTSRTCDEMLGGSEKLFFKFVPKPDCIEEVQLGVWDSDSQKTTTLKTVRLFASSDLLNITHSQVKNKDLIGFLDFKIQQKFINNYYFGHFSDHTPV